MINFKKLILSILIVKLSFLHIVAQNSETLLQIDSFGTNPGNICMFVYQNKNLNDSSLKPLVVVLHGCSQNAKDVAELTGWNKLSDINNFMVMYPQQKFSNNPNSCFNWFRGNDINKGKGEGESIFQMITYMAEKYPIDKNKIFITGLSAGAAMSVAIMATHPETFSAGAFFAGGAYKLATNQVASFNVMIGNKDITCYELAKRVVMQNVDYKGKYPKTIIYQGLSDPIVNHKNARLIINQWTTVNKADTFPDKIDTCFKNIPEITRFCYLDNKNDTCVIYYEIKNLGHRLLIKPGEKNEEGGKTGLFGVNRGFHSTYQTALDFGIIK
jgi:feruloyl esterase